MKLLQAGDRISKFLLLSPLGSGGMGTVFEAVDERLGRRVALKILHGGDGEQHERGWRNVMHECRILAELNHPNVVHLYDADITADGRPYFVMELVRGQSLRVLCEVFAPLEAFDALAFAVQIGEGLRAAHESKIMHCDLKPDNVVVTTAGQAKIVDFGLARSIERMAAGTTERLLELKGTPHYMAPEQHAGERATEKSDVFAWGVLTVEMLLGRWPFAPSTTDFPSRREAVKLICEAEPFSIVEVRGETFAEVEAVLRRMLAKNPDERSTTEEALYSLQAALGRLETEMPDASERALTSEVRLAPPPARAMARSSLPPASRTRPLLSSSTGPRLSEKLRVFLTEPLGSPRDSTVTEASPGAPPPPAAAAAGAPGDTGTEPLAPTHRSAPPAAQGTGTEPLVPAPSRAPRPAQGTGTEPLVPAPRRAPRPAQGTGTEPLVKPQRPPSTAPAVARRASDTTPNAMASSVKTAAQVKAATQVKPASEPGPMRATERRREQRKGAWVGLAIGLSGSLLAMLAWIAQARLPDAAPTQTAPPALTAIMAPTAAADLPDAYAPFDAAGDAPAPDVAPVSPAGTPTTEPAPPPEPAKAAAPLTAKPLLPARPPGVAKEPVKRLCDTLMAGCASDDYCQEYPKSPGCRREPVSTPPQRPGGTAPPRVLVPPHAKPPVNRPRF